jgi:hypothetical protein
MEPPSTKHLTKIPRPLQSATDTNTRRRRRRRRINSSHYPSHIKSIMSTSARRRLLRDFRRLQGDLPSGVTGAPMDTNIMLWQAVIFGPDDTPWEGGTFKLVLEFTEDYPNKAPAVRFLTKMFHPNICECDK